MTDSALALALVDALDDEALDALAAKLAPRLAGHRASPAPDADRWLNSKEAAAYVGLTTSSLHKLTAAREIPFAQDGPRCKCWFRRNELDAWREGGRARLAVSARREKYRTLAQRPETI